MTVELRIGKDYITNNIYIGSVRTYKDGHKEWLDDKIDVTKDAVAVVIHHIMTLEKEKGNCYCIPIDGKEYELRLVEVDESEGVDE